MYIQNIVCSECYEIEGIVYFSLFDKKIKLLVVKDSNFGYAANCVDYLNSLDDHMVNKLCEASIKYYNESLVLVGSQKLHFDNPRGILTAIQPKSLIVPIPVRGKGPILNLEFKCDWNKDCGMEWIIRENKIAYVGAFEELDPWSDFSSKRFNYI